MSNFFHFEIVSPEGIVYKESVEQVTLPTPNGEIGILPNHVTLFTKLSEGEVRVEIGGKIVSIAIAGGFLEVGKNAATVLSDYAIRADSIEIARAEESRLRAQKVMEEKRDTTEFAIAEKELQRSILELKIASKLKRRTLS